jgi:hypothetical protein
MIDGVYKTVTDNKPTGNYDGLIIAPILDDKNNLDFTDLVL